MFHIYRDLDPPYGVVLLHVTPPYAHYSPPSHPVFPPSILSFGWFSRPLPVGLVLQAVAFSWSWGARGILCFAYIHLAQQSVIFYNPGLLNGASS